MASKRKSLTLAEKINIIEEIDKSPNETRTDIADRLQIALSTLNGIYAKKNELRAAADNSGSSSKTIKKVRQVPNEQFEGVLLEWFTQNRGANIPINGTLLREEAMIIAAKLNFQDFKASNGWIDKFRRRHGISYSTVSGECSAVDQNITEHWKTELPPQTEGYEDRDIFNADETGIFYNLLPDKTLTFSGESCHGGKRSKERLTVLLCTNKDGSVKLPPLVIGKSANPRCFKNVKTLPTQHKVNKSAWMTSTLFSEFLRWFDSLIGKKKRRALLFLDRCPAHPLEADVHLRFIRLCFFPTNCTSILQPLDRGIIKCLKGYFRMDVVRKAISLLDSGTSNKPKMNVLEAMFCVRNAWNKVSAEAIQNCFKSAGFVTSDTDDDSSHCESSGEEMDDDVRSAWERLRGDADISFDSYITADNDLATNGLTSSEELCDQATQNESSDDDDESEETPLPAHEQAKFALASLQRYLLSFEEGENVIDGLQLLNDCLLKIKVDKCSKQQEITCYFSKK